MKDDFKDSDMDEETSDVAEIDEEDMDDSLADAEDESEEDAY